MSISQAVYEAQIQRIADLQARLAEAERVCDEQAKDEGLWFVAETVTEAYLQAALRRLHATIEGKSSREESAT